MLPIPILGTKHVLIIVLLMEIIYVVNLNHSSKLNQNSKSRDPNKLKNFLLQKVTN